MSEEKIVVTNDKGMKDGVLHENDMAVLNPDPEKLIPLTPELLRELAAAAQGAMSVFEEHVGAMMTPERAAEVRKLRVDEGYSWRMVAHECNERWGGDWGSNQLAGMAICEHAAKHFGEDYMEDPWN